MKNFLAVVVLLLASCSAQAAEPKAVKPGEQKDGSYVMVVPKEVVKACKEQGGCAIVTEQGIGLLIEQATREACGKEAMK